MRLIMLIVGVTVIVTVGLVIGSQSRIPVERPKKIGEAAHVFAIGRIEGATPEIPLRFEKEGRVVEILVEEGQVVKQGAVLVRLDDAEDLHLVALAQAELSLAQAALERVANGAREHERAEAKSLYMAKIAELEGAQLNWRRTEGLLRGNAISQQDADDLRTRLAGLEAQVGAAKARMELLEAPPRHDDLAMAQARVAAAKAQMDLAACKLDRTRLRALRDSQVLNIDVEEGELTGPTASTPVIVLADTSRFRVRAFVEELDVLKLSVGIKARVTADALGERQLEGTLAQLSPHMGRKQLWNNDPAERYDTKTREVWIDLREDEGNLVIGLPVDVVVDLSSAPEGPATPGPPASLLYRTSSLPPETPHPR